jgi:hypothetical protein
MKIQLDTIAKVIKVEGTINLGEFFKAIKDLLPNDTWKEYKLETNTVINWYRYPIYDYYPKPYNPYPWWPTITYTVVDNTTITEQGSGITAEGIYCIEV